MFLDEIRQQAQANTAEEICGFVVHDGTGGFRAEQMPNLAKNPVENFRLSPEEALKRIKEGTLVGYYHSHQKDKAEFSPQDIASAEDCQLPLFLYSIPDDTAVSYVPNAVRRMPVEGRSYLPLVFDCASAVQDYYKLVLGIDTPPIPRAYVKGQIREVELFPYFEKIGAKRVNSLQKNDVIVMSIRDTVPNHVGLYLGDTHFMHQCSPGTAKRDVYGGYWAKNTVAIFRHPNFIHD